MPIAIECPGYGHPYTLNDRFAGQTVKCKQCSGPIVVPVGQRTAPSADWLLNEAQPLQAAKSGPARPTSPLANIPNGRSKQKKPGLVSWQSAVVATACLVGIMAVAAGHAGGTALLSGLMLIAAGIFSIAGAAYDWDWFINHYKARLFLKIFGRTGTRAFYGVLGTAVLLGGVLTAVGVVKVDSRRRRFAMTQPAHPQAAPAPKAGDASTDRGRLTGRFGPIETIRPAPFNAPKPSAASSPTLALPSANKDGADAVSAGDTQIFGGSFDPAFRDQAPDGGVLVGLEVGTAPGFGGEIVRTVRPIFHTANGEEVLGQEHGSDAMKVTSVKAKEGYAIGGIIVKAGLCVDGFSIVFMRVNGDMLDPGDSYESEWFGGIGGNDKTKLGCEGQPVIALIGKSNGRQCTGLGLSMKH